MVQLAPPVHWVWHPSRQSVRLQVAPDVQTNWQPAAEAQLIVQLDARSQVVKQASPRQFTSQFGEPEVHV
jgi:hypothetical protein